MEFSEESPWKYEDKEQTNMNLPVGFSFDDEDDDDDDEYDCPQASPRASSASAVSFPVCPMSPETPYTRSPLHRSSPFPLFLYDCLASLHFSKGSILSIAVTKDSIFTGSSTSKIHAWKLPDCMDMGCVKSPSGEIRAMSAHGKMLFTTHGDCRTRAWESSPAEKFRLKKIATLPPRRKSFFPFTKKGKNNNNSTPWHNRVSVSCLAYNTKEELLFTGLADQTVNVWKISEKKRTESFMAHKGRVSAIVVNQQDGCIFTCSCDGTLKMWRRVYRESSHILIMVLLSQPFPINALALSSSPSDCFLYSGSSDGIINFWEKETVSGRYNHAGFLRGHHFAILCLATIGGLILSGSEDATIRIWRREYGSPLHSSLTVIDGHHGPVKCLAAVMESDFESVGGILVCSASLDQTLKVWRVKVSDS